MKRSILLCLFVNMLVLHSKAQTAGIDVYINEFHYDNVGVDAGEFIEIAGPAGTDLSTFSLTLYNGATGALYDTPILSGIIPDEGNGFGTLCINFPSNGIQNGSPDGIALTDGGGTTQFLSYEGSFSAIDGLAAGLTSTDILVFEDGTTNGESLQLVGSGTIYSDFIWSTQMAETPCAMNTGQTIGNVCETTATINVSECDIYTSPSGNYSWTTSGMYMDTIPNAALCDSVITINLTINTSPSVSYSEPITTICVYNAAFNLSGESPAGGTFSGAGVTGNSFDPSVAGVGSFNISYTYSDGNNCTGVAMSTIVVDACSSLEELQKDFIVYPNPASGTVQIKFEIGKQANITLIDLAGNEVLKSTITNQEQIDIKELEAGEYIILFESDDKRSFEKLIIQ